MQILKPCFYSPSAGYYPKSDFTPEKPSQYKRLH